MRRGGGGKNVTKWLRKAEETNKKKVADLRTILSQNPGFSTAWLKQNALTDEEKGYTLQNYREAGWYLEKPAVLRAAGFTQIEIDNEIDRAGVWWKAEEAAAALAAEAEAAAAKEQEEEEGAARQEEAEAGAAAAAAAEAAKAEEEGAEAEEEEEEG